VTRVRVCLMIEGQEGVTWDEWTALARACEESGLEGLFRSDHYLGIDDRGRGSLDAWATLSALSAVTERIRLGTMVSPATFRHPSVLAKAAATADQVSGGRIELGLGAGWFEAEHRAYGFPFPGTPERLGRFAEQLEIVHRQWTEESFDFDGRYYRLEGCRALPKPLQQPRPPLIVGGSGGRGTIDPAVRFADEYNTFFADVETCRSRRRKLDEACERAGRDPATIAFSLMTTCVVGEDEGALRRRLAALAARASSFRDPDGLPSAVIAGTSDQVVERLRTLETAGVERVMLQHLVHDDVEMVHVLGEQVAPAVAS
jgi:F420-dependent oxidoreductase-like protein